MRCWQYVRTTDKHKHEDIDMLVGLDCFIKPSGLKMSNDHVLHNTRAEKWND